MKKLLKIAAVLVVLLIVALVACVIYIDSVARSGVEYAATRALGVKTSLGDMDVSILGSRVEMENLIVQNPEGFDAKNFLELDQGQVAVSLGTLTKKRVVIPTLHLKGLEMFLEKKDGKANYQVIMDNLALKPVPPEDAKTYVINDLLLTDITVHANLLPVGGQLTQKSITIPEIQLRDVGSDNAGGVALEKLTGIIIQAVMEGVIKNAGDLPVGLVAELGQGLGKLEEIPAQGVKIIEQSGNELKESVGEAAKDINKAVEGLGGLLGGKKKDAAKDAPKDAQPAAPEEE